MPTRGRFVGASRILLAVLEVVYVVNTPTAYSGGLWFNSQHKER